MPSKNKRFADSSLASSRWRRAPSTPSVPPTLRRRARAATSGTITAPTYDSNDNTTSAQMHRFFAKMASAGIDLGDNVLADPWAQSSPGLRRPPPLGVKNLECVPRAVSLAC